MKRARASGLGEAAESAEAAERRRMEEALRESEERYRTLADNAPDIITRFDRELRHLYVNRAAERTTGLPREAFLGKSNAELGMPAELVAFWHGHIGRVFETGQPGGMEFQYGGPQGPGWYEARLVPEFGADGEVASVLCITRDVTERKRMEEALREADRRKTDFLAVLSHELRNPLAPINYSLYVLERAAPGSEQARRAQAVIQRQVAHLVRLVDDLLDSTRIARGKVELRRTRLELGELVRRAEEEHRPAFASAGVELGLHLPEEPLWLEADGARLAQVVGNLLQNAVKFTPRGGHVRLAVEREGAQAVLRVRDSGTGIEPALLARIFEPFTQADRTLERSRGGLGLGLALVKGLVELHGGTVGAHSEGPGRGAEFTVRLPLEQVPAEALAPAPQAAPFPRRRVLVIEDNLDGAESLREALELLGQQVRVAYDGRQGIEAARDFLPELVLCDIGLPGMDGYAVARALRAEETLRGAVLVAVTGYAQPEDRHRALEAGFAQHIAKPPSIEDLERLLGQAR